MEGMATIKTKKWLPHGPRNLNFLNHTLIIHILLQFPPKLWSEDSLGKIGKKLGKPPEVHKNTTILWGNGG